MFVAVQSFAVGTETTYVARNVATAVAEQFSADSRDAISPQLALVFMDNSFDHKTALKTIRSKLGRGVTLIGCTTAGEICSGRPIRQPSITMMLLGSDTCTFYADVEKHLKNDSRTAGERIGKTLKKKLRPHPSLVITFADGLTGNGADLIAGMAATLPKETTVVGANAGDLEAYHTTHQFLDTSVYTDAVVAVGIAGTLPFAVAAAHGWLSVGLPKTITRVEGTTVKDIDGRPAIQLYEEYLGLSGAETLKKNGLGDIALSYPLGIQASSCDDPTVSKDILPRVPLSVDEEGGIVFSDTIAENTKVRLMVGNAPDAVAAAKHVAATTYNTLSPILPQVALVFSSHVRKSLYSSREEAAMEMGAITDIIGNTVPLCGLYSYGEYAPLHTTSPNHPTTPELHNDSIVLLLLGQE